MIKDKSIYIKNIYYMLSYAYQNLRHESYERIQTEAFDNVHDLFAAILAAGVQSQLKKGIAREYMEKTEAVSALRGKIDITRSIGHIMQRDNKLVCRYGELSENNAMNQIIKTTADMLIRLDTVKKDNRARLKRAMAYFSHVDTVIPSSIQWSKLRYHRNNQTYRMLMNVCYLVLVNLLLTNEAGNHQLAAFLDEQGTEKLFEKFVLEYYKKHHPELRAKASQVSWAIDDGVMDFLPIMQTDITLQNKDKALIIDTKFYSQSMQVHSQYDTRTIHSQNLYQIYTYVKNKDHLKTGDVSGMLLYAKTDESIVPDVDYRMDGNRISVKTLDLNCPFSLIAQQLDRFAEPLIKA